MPLVRVFANTDVDLFDFNAACSEIIPAGMNSPMGPLTPGSVQIEGRHKVPSKDDFMVDVFVEIEAYDYEDRDANLDDRCNAIKEAFNTLFPDLTFAVWGKLVRAGWASDVSDPDFDGEMSMEAAVKRTQFWLSTYGRELRSLRGFRPRPDDDDRYKPPWLRSDRESSPKVGWQTCSGGDA